MGKSVLAHLTRSLYAVLSSCAQLWRLDSFACEGAFKLNMYGVAARGFSMLDTRLRGDDKSL